MTFGSLCYDWLSLPALREASTACNRNFKAFMGTTKMVL